MIKLRYLIIFSLLLSGFQFIFSQSEYIPRGQNGIGGGLGFNTNRDATGFSFFAGYSYQGFLDGKLTYTTYSRGKISSGVLMPIITYYLYKQEDAELVPTIGLSMGYSKYTIKEVKTFIEPDPQIISWRSYQKEVEERIDVFQIGASVQKRFGYWKSVFIEPVLATNISLKKSGWDFAIRGGVALGTRVVRGPILIVTPAFELQSGLMTFFIAVNAIAEI